MYPTVNVSVILATWKVSSPEARKFFLEKFGFKTEEQFLTYVTTQLEDEYKTYVTNTESSGTNRGVQSYGEYVAQKNLMLVIPPILLVIGIFGNVLSFVILRKRLLFKQSTYFYLSTLAIFDTGVLLVGLLGQWITALTEYRLVTYSNWVCKLSQFLGYTFSDVSVWLIVIVTTERYIVVCKPLKTLYICNLRRAKIVLSILLCGMATINTHFFWTVQVVGSTKNKTLSCAGHGRYRTLVDDIWPWVDAFVYSFIPFVLITYFNCVIICRVSKARRSRDELQNTGLACNCVTEGRDAFKKSETKVTVTLLSISITFLITALPLNIYIITAAIWNNYIATFPQGTRAKFALADTISTLLMYTNHSINFFLYCATGAKFRHQLASIVCSGRYGNDEDAQPIKFTSLKTNSSEERRQNGFDLKAKPRVTLATYYH